MAVRLGRAAKFRVVKKQAGLPDEVRLVDADKLQLEALAPGAHYDIQLVEAAATSSTSQGTVHTIDGWGSWT